MYGSACRPYVLQCFPQKCPYCRMERYTRRGVDMFTACSKYYYKRINGDAKEEISHPDGCITSVSSWSDLKANVSYVKNFVKTLSWHAFQVVSQRRCRYLKAWLNISIIALAPIVNIFWPYRTGPCWFVPCKHSAVTAVNSKPGGNGETGQLCHWKCILSRTNFWKTVWHIHAYYVRLHVESELNSRFYHLWKYKVW